ncbi:GDSL-type esterase/lipase family protein [Pedobacter sp. BAL39]|uniref:SGNH/GDSL hydrolase family protein n=1 Tax=Pedobacter sp. BAL39 TaxID=391596 RepID=UPI00031E8290|nr:GDSL-type esterase/lipase family protein [Pedobacter sp. BAL39]
MNRRQLVKNGLVTIASAVVTSPLLAITSHSGNDDHQRTAAAASERNNDQVINAGIGGNNTVDLLKRIDKDCLMHDPALTILMVGTNDMNSVKHVPLEQYKTNLETLAKKIRKSGSKLLMMTILPAYEPYLLTRHPAAFYQPEGVTVRRSQVNKVIREVAAKYKAALLDMELRFLAIGKVGTDQDSLIQNEANSNKTDGIHPTANGYRFIGLSVYDYIVDYQLPTSNIVCFGDSITHGDGSIDRNSYPAFLNKLLNQKAL